MNEISFQRHVIYPIYLYHIVIFHICIYIQHAPSMFYFLDRLQGPHPSSGEIWSRYVLHDRFWQMPKMFFVKPGFWSLTNFHRFYISFPKARRVSLMTLVCEKPKTNPYLNRMGLRQFCGVSRCDARFQPENRREVTQSWRRRSTRRNVVIVGVTGSSQLWDFHRICGLSAAATVPQGEQRLLLNSKLLWAEEIGAIREVISSAAEGWNDLKRSLRLKNCPKLWLEHVRFEDKIS